MDSGCGQYRTFEIRSRSVRCVFVQRRTLLEERVERLTVAREWPPAACDALPRLLRCDLEEQRERAPGESRSRPLGAESAASDLHDRELAAPEDIERDLLFELAEGSFAIGLEDLRDGSPAPFLDKRIHGDERAPETFRQLRPECRLARAHEADERKLPIQRRQRPVGQLIRSR